MNGNRTFLCPNCGVLRRAVSPNFKEGTEVKSWPKHCGKAMLLLGYIASQAATQITLNQRIRWAKPGARVKVHRGKKRWKPILNERNLKDAYPLV